MTRGIIIFLAFFSASMFAQQNLTLHRSFWAPIYRGTAVDYCFFNTKICGKKVATEYCRFMGYRSADKIIKANSIGHTRYLASSMHCKNVHCNGFKMIRCVGKIIHKPMPAYLYTKKRFPSPRFLGLRVDFCADGKSRGCGRKAAYSFCRRQGYMQTIGFKKESNLAITKAINNQLVCTGGKCLGFEYINCAR